MSKQTAQNKKRIIGRLLLAVMLSVITLRFSVFCMSKCWPQQSTCSDSARIVGLVGKRRGALISWVIRLRKALSNSKTRNPEFFFLNRKSPTLAELGLD